VNCADPDRAAAAVGRLSASGVRIADFSVNQPTLDEVFLALTGRPADAVPAPHVPSQTAEDRS
jgi:ABC-2 type transport system ATP-binding protein